jgi:hypothetical protein
MWEEKKWRPKEATETGNCMSRGERSELDEFCPMGHSATMGSAVNEPEPLGLFWFLLQKQKELAEGETLVFMERLRQSSIWRRMCF